MEKKIVTGKKILVHAVCAPQSIQKGMRGHLLISAYLPARHEETRAPPAAFWTNGSVSQRASLVPCREAMPRTKRSNRETKTPPNRSGTMLQPHPGIAYRPPLVRPQYRTRVRTVFNIGAGTTDSQPSPRVTTLSKVAREAAGAR